VTPLSFSQQGKHTGDGKIVDETNQSSEELLESRLKEAKVYRSMGLFEESRDVYTRILLEFPEIPPHSRARIQEEIDQIEAELDERSEDDLDTALSTEALSFIRQEVAGGEDPEDVLSRAKAFMETGQNKEALEEFQKLLGMDFPADRLHGHLVECVLRLCGPDEAPSRVDELLSASSLGKRERARLKFKLGVELENRGRVETAIDLYRSARGIIPEDLNMRSALDAKIAGLSKGSRYAYLLNQGWISQGDLEEARNRADKAGSSVEAVLVEAHGLSKEEIGRSLSVYYDLPFKTYDPNMTVPSDLFTGLDRATLSLDGWVPLGSYEGEADVLMEAPDDTAKIKRIQQLLNRDKLTLAVGFREDIQAYIERFFEALELAEKAAETKERTQPKERQQRRERRYVPSIPDFSYVEFSIQNDGSAPREHRLEVLNASEHGIGLLLRKDDGDLAETLQPGSVIPNMTFYATWTLIQADATVRHLTPITRGRHKGHYLLGVESKEIIESSKVPY
jgi:tetratricopeptide (TPR) repeat protein